MLAVNFAAREAREAQAFRLLWSRRFDMKSQSNKTRELQLPCFVGRSDRIRTCSALHRRIVAARCSGTRFLRRLALGGFVAKKRYLIVFSYYPWPRYGSELHEVAGRTAAFQEKNNRGICLCYFLVGVTGF